MPDRQTFEKRSAAKRKVTSFCSLLLCVFLRSRWLHSETPSAWLALKPYRVLLVVDRWSDPTCLLVDHEKDNFQPVAAVLKAWSVPFDILRLDQQHLDGSYLLRRSGAVRYGTIVWLADSDSYSGQDFASLQKAVHAGTSLIVVNSRFLDPALEQLLELKFKEFYTATVPFRVAQEHFITRDVAARKVALPALSWNFSDRLWVLPKGAQVLIEQRGHPVVTVNQLQAEVSAIWLGPPNQSLLCHSAFWRNIFFRSLIWSMGYVVRPNIDYAYHVIFELDDWGTADKGFLSYWRYLEPSKETIRQYLIAPLAQHRAVATAEVDTGYVDRVSKRIVSPWTRKFTDLYGLHQDYASTRRGLTDGVAQGVLEIESHGWTHMEPDLESSPGPWWTSSLAGEASVVGWYGEFEDQRRGKEVPAITQIFHMKRSLADLREDFGVTALELKPGNNAWSKSPLNNTARLAAGVGFGLFHGDNATYYLDRQLTLDMADVIPDFNTGYDRLRALDPKHWPAHPDGPVILGFHDRDIALDHRFLDQLFAVLPVHYRTLTTNQYVAVLHTRINSLADHDGWQLTFTVDRHYCEYFDKHPSSWQLWLSDPLRRQLAAAGYSKSSMDGKTVAYVRAAKLLSATLTIDVPGGLGVHVWKLESAGNGPRP